MSEPVAASLDAVYRHAERIVGRRIADEFILVPIVGHGAELDSIYNLNRVGAFIWEQVDGRRTGRSIVDEMLRRFQVERAAAEADYCAFVRMLLGIRALNLVTG